jgi:mono/diheme cytochrome c family protein
MNLRLRALAGLAGVALLVLGCNKQADTTSEGTPPPGGPGGPAAVKPAANATAEEMFQQQCVKCHRPAGQAGGPKGKMGGPDLTKPAEDSAHNTADWIAEHIKDPKAHNPMSRMPKFEATLTPEQIKKLADYVAGMKSS